MRALNALGVVTALTLGSSAIAATEMGIDINSLSAAYTGTAPFGLTATGVIDLFHDNNSVLAGIDLDGQRQTHTASLFSFDGEVHLSNGTVQGGFITITNSDSTSYTAQIVAGVGRVRVQAGQGFSIDGLTFQGLFNGPTFAGVSIPEFFSGQPLGGAFLTFKFRPDENGYDPDSDIDLFIQVPLPTGAGLAAAGLLSLALIRRRR